MLGGLRVLQAEREITRFRTQKNAALLAYLAYYLHRAHPREVLVELLWPWSAPAAGRKSLRVALTSLRHQLEPPGVPQGSVILADQFSIRVNPQTVTTDVAEFERALAAAQESQDDLTRRQRLREAVDLYAGVLLPGFYQDWVLPEQERLAGLFCQAVRNLVAALEERHELEGALGYAGKAVAVDPLREECQCELMRLLAAAGRHQAALRQYEEYARLVQQQLGETPSPTARRLAEQIAAREVAQPEAPALGRVATKARRPEVAPPAFGTLTFLVTGIAGPMCSQDRACPEYEVARRGCDQTVRAVVGRHGGQVAQESDGALVVSFGRATDAAACAVACQQALARKRWPKATGPLRVAMALHTGEVAPEEGSTARGVGDEALAMLAAAHGGQILCSEATAGLLRQGRAEGQQVADLGAYYVTGAGRPARLFQLTRPDGQPEAFPPPKAQAAMGGHLPRSLTRFFGREQELQWLRDLLLCEDVRLVTLTGPGGSGKTRLAMEAARQLLDQFQGAVWFAPLQELADPELILGAVVEGLGLRPAPQTEPIDQAAALLSRQPSLLVVDNLEHLLEEGSRAVATLLARVPTLTCLVTSRQTLGLSGERDLFVGPLPTPTAAATPEELVACASVQLLVDRAQAVRADFQVAAANAAAVAKICRRLEGLPLALELAGARVPVMTPAHLLERLDRQFELLVTRQRDVPDRHRSLWAALDWSFRLLSPELQRFLARLSVFRGGWTLEASTGVCEGARAGERLEQLRECSLVMIDPGQTGETRYRMLETVREYARTQLPEADWRALLDRHAAHYLALAEEARPHLEPTQRTEAKVRMEAQWLARLEAEADNLRAALEWLRQAPNAADEGLRLARALAPFWGERRWPEALRHLSDMLEREGARRPTAARAAVLYSAACVCCSLHENARAESYYAEAKTIFDALGDRYGAANCLEYLGLMAGRQGRLDEEGVLYEQSLALHQELGDPRRIAGVLNRLVSVARDRGDSDKARRLAFEALSIGRDLDDLHNRTEALGWLATLEEDAGRYAEARALREQVVTAQRAAAPTAFRTGRVLHHLGRCCVSQGDLAAAKRYLAEAVPIFQEIGLDAEVAGIHRELAQLARARGDLDAAEASARDALAIHQELADPNGCASDRELLALITSDRGEYRTARALFEEVIACNRQTGNMLGAARSLARLGRVCRQHGDLAAARTFVEQAIAERRALRAERGIVELLLLLGQTADEQGDAGGALARYREGLTAEPEESENDDALDCLIGSALWFAAHHEPRRAACLLGAADRQREIARLRRDHKPPRHVLADLRSALGRKEFAAARAEGRAMTWDEAVAHALVPSEVTPEPVPTRRRRAPAKPPGS
jgi:predicted ATPase/DNA-binding SARP family transcriptional activator